MTRVTMKGVSRIDPPATVQDERRALSAMFERMRKVVGENVHGPRALIVIDRTGYATTIRVAVEGVIQ